MIEVPTERLAVIDVETTGPNPFVHEVLSVAIVPLKPELPPAIVYIRPETSQWTDYARKLFSGYQDEWDRQAVSPLQACIRLEQYFEQAFEGELVTPIGHNIGFDLAFLNRLVFVAGRQQFEHLSHRAVDTHSLLYLLYLQGKIPERALSSDGAFDYFNVTPPITNRHTALGDARATCELFFRLVAMFDESARAPRRRHG